MRWKQFFTPVESVTAPKGREMAASLSATELTILDVRQAKEYQQAHLPGATLIPLPQLADRMTELDAAKNILVYCAVGGRSRIAAQMLATNGFHKVFNLSGGIKGWEAQVARGAEEVGVSYFTAVESPERVVRVAYSLEQGLRDFYLQMTSRVAHEKAKKIFARLAEVELSHQERLFELYASTSGREISRQDFEAQVAVEAAEGGVTTEQYIEFFQPEQATTEDILALAMSIEAQALDLYHRAAKRCRDPRSSALLLALSAEEKIHLQMLGDVIDNP